MAFDQTLVQIRERSFLDVLDLALVAIRERPGTLGLAALAGVAPLAAFNALLIASSEDTAGLLFYLILLEIPWATAPLTVVLGGLMFGERPSVWRVFKTLARSLLPMIFYQVIIRSIFVVILVLYPIVPIRLAFVNEVILLERGRWWRVVRRSSELCEQRGGELFGQWLMQLIFGGIFVLAFWAGAGALTQALVRSEVTWEPRWADLLGVRAHLALWVAVAFFGVVRFFTYIDQRIRLEGWEVELRLRNVGQAWEDGRR